MQPLDWIQAAVYLAVGLVLAYFAGVFRRHAIRPPRSLIVREAMPGDLLTAALAGFGASMFVPSLYLLAVVPHNAKPTQHQTLCTFALNAAAGFAALAFADALQRRDQLRLPRLSAGLAVGLLAGCWVIPLVLFTTDFVQLLMQLAHAGPPQEHQLLTIFQSAGAADRLLIVLSAAVLAPLYEELIFRGHIQPALRQTTGNPWFSVMLTAALFALVHGIWWMMPPLFVLALGLGFLYERTRNIWAPVTLHALFNTLALTIEYLAPHHA